MSGDPVVELTEESALRAAYTVMAQLRPVGEDEFIRLLTEMRADNGYRLFAIRSGKDEAIRALGGVVVQVNLYHGKHAWVHDLVVDEPFRGQGYGGRLLSWLGEWADSEGCSCLELASGVWRDDAHRFYEQAGMEKYCVTFKKELSAPTPY